MKRSILISSAIVSFALVSLVAYATNGSISSPSAWQEFTPEETVDITFNAEDWQSYVVYICDTVDVGDMSGSALESYLNDQDCIRDYIDVEAESSETEITLEIPPYMLWAWEYSVHVIEYGCSSPCQSGTDWDFGSQDCLDYDDPGPLPPQPPEEDNG